MESLIRILLIILIFLIINFAMYIYIGTKIKNRRMLEEEPEQKESCEGCVNWDCYKDGVHYCILNNESQCLDNDYLLKEYKW